MGTFKSKDITAEMLARAGVPASARKGPGRGVLRAPGVMNKTEAAYAIHLDARVALGEVQAYWFEGIKLRLAAVTFYTPDFFVLLADGLLECHEVKGFWEDDARVKIKVAAAMFPFRFVAVTSAGKDKGFNYEII